MSSKTDHEMIEETLQRVLRMETRMVQLGDHVGANLRSKQRIDIEPTATCVVAYVDSYDVSFSRIMAEVKDSTHFTRCAALADEGGMFKVEVRMGNRRSYLTISEIFIPAK